MHREIVDMMSDYPVSRDLVIDHVDNNGLNNQRNNLRVRTRNENTRMYHAIQARKLAKSSRQIDSPSDQGPLPKSVDAAGRLTSSVRRHKTLRSTHTNGS